MAAPPRCGPFDLVQPIGEGGSGVVWRARHRTQDIEVALKVLTLGSERLSAAFRNETRAAARLDHPNIVMLFEQGHISPVDARQSHGVLQAGAPFLAMELCTGGVMAQRKPRTSWPLLRHQLGEILAALAHAHSRGVIHRDLKPSNTLLQGLGEAAQVKLSDFGIAHALVMNAAEADERDERLSGTLQYMAPEQLSGQWRDEGPWTDLYALGVMTYEAVGGRSPWRATTRDELVTALLKGAPPVRPRMPVPEGLQKWLDGLLAKRPVERFQSAAAALLALQRLTDPIVWESDCKGPAPARLKVPATPAALSTEEAVTDNNSPQRSLSLQGAGLGLHGLRPARLAGRESEKQQLWRELLSMVRSRQPSVIILRNPMGVGTSKLAKWLSENAHSALGAGLMAATHGPIPRPGDGLPVMIGRYLQCTRLDRERRQSRCARIITDFPLQDDSAFEAAALDDLVALGESSNRSLTVAAQDRALRRTLRRLARAQPLILTVDNGQWANNALCLAEKLLDDDVHGLPVLLLILVDEEALAPGSAEEHKLSVLETRPRSLTLRLGNITATAHRGLVKDLLDLAPSLLDRVCSVTNGDALFASSLLRHWVRTQSLVNSEEGFVLRAGAPQFLPTSLNELWDHQLRELATKLEGISIEQLLFSLEIAAALGESVYDNEWRAACAQAGVPIHDELAQQLSELNIVSHTHLGWRFKHGLVRQHLESQGKLDLAETHYRRALELYESLDAADATTAKCNLGYVLIARSQYQEAGKILQGLWDSAPTRERYIDRMWILCGLLACAGAQGDWRQWDQLHAQVLALGDTGIFDEDLARVTQRAGDLARVSGHEKRAKDAYTVALSQYEGMQKRSNAAEIRRLLADLGACV